MRSARFGSGRRRRGAVILANPELQERELIKLASLAEALTDALRTAASPIRWPVSRRDRESRSSGSRSREDSGPWCLDLGRMGALVPGADGGMHNATEIAGEHVLADVAAGGVVWRRKAIHLVRRYSKSVVLQDVGCSGSDGSRTRDLRRDRPIRAVGRSATEGYLSLEIPDIQRGAARVYGDPRQIVVAS